MQHLQWRDRHVTQLPSFPQDLVLLNKRVQLASLDSYPKQLRSPDECATAHQCFRVRALQQYATTFLVP